MTSHPPLQASLEITLACIFLIGCGLLAQPEGRPPAYTEEQVVENVVTYLETVFGERIPTVSDYFRAEGPAPGLERELELARCSRELGVTVESQRLRISPGCLDWITARRRNGVTEPSLYYAALREVLDLDLARTRIEAIVPPQRDETYYRVLVREAGTGATLELYHIPRRDPASLTRLGIHRINGELVTDLLGPNLEGWSR